MPVQAMATSMPPAPPIQPTTVKFFFGRISRDEAEQVLKNRGCCEGLYLLRESMTIAGNYALSICHQNRIHHYSIERQSDGKVMIQDGKRFKGPVELVEHHQKILDGFLTKPTLACERQPDQQPMAWPGVTMFELERILYEKTQNLTGKDLEMAFGPQRQTLIQQIAKELHKEQPWFHGRITRDGADDAMKSDKHYDGKFLVRERDDRSYALSLSYRSETKHYKIDKFKPSGEQEYLLAIEDGPRFDSLMDMVGHYHNKTDGLLCKLTTPCVKPGFKKKNRGIIQQPNAMYGLPPPGSVPVPGPNQKPLKTEDGPEYPSPPSTVSQPPSLVPIPKSRTRPPSKPPRVRPLNQIINDPLVMAHGIINKSLQDDIWDEPPDIPEVEGDLGISGLNLDNHSTQADPPPPLPRVPAVNQLNNSPIDDDPQKIYDSVPRTEEVFNLNNNDLELHDKLGAGNFGSVMRGVLRRNGQTIPVAIKTLKQDDIPNAGAAIMKEARVMAELQHRNIVRLIGVCRSETIMLVMELARLGQLSKYLKKHPTLTVKTTIELMFQVAEGMAYLESKNFVHRDLAARNVLLVNEHFAKISDFGMSKALGLGNNYYQAETAGKWPLKWYAPECIYFFKFDSKSDVWSYGVTLWEALSYGAKPYKGLKGQLILELIENGERLGRPDRCPPGVYDIMKKCWSYEKAHRPTFKELVELLRKFK